MLNVNYTLCVKLYRVCKITHTKFLSLGNFTLTPLVTLATHMSCVTHMWDACGIFISYDVGCMWDLKESKNNQIQDSLL